MSWLNDTEEFDPNYPDPSLDPNLLPGTQDQPGGPPPVLPGTPTMPNTGTLPGDPGTPPPLDSSPWAPPSGPTPPGLPGMQNGQPSDGSAPPSSGNLWLNLLKQLGATTGGGNNASNAIAGGLGALNQSVQAGAQRQATADLQNQRVALEQSQADPYKSLMYQTTNANKADRLANTDFAAKPVQVAGRYGDAAGPTTPSATWNPSPSTRGNARAVLAMILAGKKTPTMTDPKNYGKEPAVENAPDYTPPWLADQLRSQGH